MAGVSLYDIKYCEVRKTEYVTVLLCSEGSVDLTGERMGPRWRRNKYRALGVKGSTQLCKVEESDHY